MNNDEGIPRHADGTGTVARAATRTHARAMVDSQQAQQQDSGAGSQGRASAEHTDQQRSGLTPARAEGARAMTGDGYGRHWDYRVFSELDTEPDAPNSGRRRLHLRMVWYVSMSEDYPTPADVFAIAHERAEPSGETIEALLIDLARMTAALDRPSLVLAEWRGYLTRKVSLGATMESPTRKDESCS